MLRRAAHSLLVVAAVAAAFSTLGPLTGRYRVLVVESPSMTPALPVGSWAIEVPAARRNVKVGDIVTFTAPDQPGALRTHRVVAVLEPGDSPVVRTKGDANADADPVPVRLTDGRLWRVVFAVPFLGAVQQGLGDPRVLLGLVNIAALVFVGGTALDAVRRRPWRARPVVVAGIAPQVVPQRIRLRLRSPAHALAPVAPPAPTTRVRLRRRAGSVAVASTLLVLATSGAASAAQTASVSVGQAAIGSATLQPPTNVTATCHTLLGITGVDVAWTATTSTFATGYTIYRKQGAGAYGVLTTVAGRGTVAYRDTTAIVVGSFTYKLQATYASWTSVDSGSATVNVVLLC